MSIRTTVDIPEQIHQQLRHRAAQSGRSIRSLILFAIEQTYGDPESKSEYVSGPLVTGKGKLGPQFPVDENPHDLVFS
jgi:hypothetical protein